MIDCAHGIPLDMFCGECASVPSKSIADTLAERGSRYGEFPDHAAITQSIKDTLRGGRSWTVMQHDQREAVEMIAHKLGRIVNGDPDYADSWVDIEGYARLVSQRLGGAA